jgi:TonB family protein
MNIRATFLSTALPALLAFSLSAQEPEKPTAPKSDVQIRAEALMVKARHLSDIRAKGAPAFRLKANFTFVGKDLENAQGTYTEDWISDSQWRRETLVKGLRRIEVGTANRTWTLDNSKDFPETATRLPALMNIFPPASSTFEFDSIADNADQKPPEQCATTKRGSQQEQYRFCFDQTSGALLAKLSPEIRPKNMTDYSCFYGIFRKFGDAWFPREMACFENKHRQLEAKVEDLSAEPTPDPTLFTPPPGATERARCSGTSARPIQTISPEPGFPTGSGNGSSFVALSLTVDMQGKPQDLRVSRSGGQGFDEAALAAVQKWRFKPGTCDGDPMPMEVAVEVDFNRQGGTATHRH